jgi:integrase
MPTTFAFTEPKIRALVPPQDGRDREYHKDTKVPGLQVCVTAAGSKAYYYVRRMDGRPTRVLLGSAEKLSVEAARDAARIHAARVAQGDNPQAERRQKRQQPTLADLWKHWLIYAKAHKRASSVAEDERQYKRFLETTWANRRLGAIKRSDVQALHAQIGADNGIYAANRLIALLSAMFNKADDIGHRGPNPAAKITKFKETSRDRFLQPDELKAFFTALEAEDELFRDFFAVSLLTGARRGNVRTMRWDDLLLDAETPIWHIPETKNGHAVVVPLVPAVVGILNRRRESASGAEWVFPGRYGHGHLFNPNKAWKRICTRAGLADLRPHDLRRSLGSWMAGQNVSLTIIGKALGHRTASATMIYSRLAIDPVRAAVEHAADAMIQAAGTKLLGTTPTQIDNEVKHDGQAKE